MGTVYSGRVVKNKRGMRVGDRVAVKVLHPHLGDDPTSVSRFKREAGLGLTMRHPNIVQILQVGTEIVDGLQIHFLVQEFVEGVTLKVFIQEAGLLGDPFLRKIAIQVAKALAYIHEKGIIHRDLKPENVFLEPEGVIKVVDFGFSHAERALMNHDSSEGFFGTVAYAAPERFGAGQVGTASDIYSFGILLYELALGENPYLGEDLSSTIARHLYTRPEEPRNKNPYISPFMSLFITALMEKDPNRRLGPAFRLLRILNKGESSRWWRSVRPETGERGLSARRQELPVIRRTEVLGRRRESTTLLTLFDEVATGKGSRAVCVSGEAGIGKTRLVDRLLEEMDSLGRPGKLILVEGAPGSIKVPYFPLLSALKNTLGLGGLDRETRRKSLQKKLEMLFSGDRHEKAEGLAHFLISALPDSGGALGDISPELTARRFADLFKALAKETPLLIVVENVLIADPSTFRVLLSLLGYLRTTSVMFIFTLRPGETFRDEQERPNELERLLEAMELCGGRHWIDLKRLSREEINRMLCALGFPDKIANGPFGERVFTVTEGNPYLALEIAKLIEVEGRLLRGDLNWHGLIQEIPSSIQDI
ncbi:MAG: protein kinase, partial [Planctomycetes bacterium]|nr:protein kinase [Planctomycetota bacterium]